MKARFLGLGIVLGIVLTLTLGFAYRGNGMIMNGFAGAHGDMRAAMEAMHDSPQMQAMHERMPEQLRAQCDAAHEQMESSGMMGSEGMMGPGGVASGGMMGGSGGMMGS
jgi:hypothetical protein